MSHKFNQCLRRHLILIVYSRWSFHYIKISWWKRVHYGFTATKDSEFGDCCLDISKAEKRLIRATFKTYEKTGTLVFLKLFKYVVEVYEFQQRISLTMDKFGNLIKKSKKVGKISLSMAPNQRNTRFVLLHLQKSVNLFSQ